MICLWFFCIAGLLRIEVSWLSENITILILFILIILGSVILGYSNTHFAPEPKVKMSLILHTRFMGFLLILDLLFGKSVWYFDLARNFGFLGLFLLGTFIFYKRNLNLNVAKIPPFE
ncbi:hypothetical protein [Acinetobacter baumannii]|uniref:hypothetical protein n=1 Tax=Acinetobacter baumannii TaxID=470 RepID=UPI001C057A60|nr:hypothetical protein [Acinetobacter baumannii]